MKLNTMLDNHGRIVLRFHPNGWAIRRQERDWDARSYRGGIADAAGPKVWWEVKRYATGGRRRESFRTLREARAFCDANEGWPPTSPSLRHPAPHPQDREAG